MRTTRTPGVSLSTKNIACAPACGPSAILPWKKQYEAWLYDVTCIFTPFRT